MENSNHTLVGMKDFPTLTLGRSTMKIDVEKTRELYQRLPKPKIDSAYINFMRNINLRRESAGAFFEQYGIDLSKCSDLDVGEVDPYYQSIWYIGYYPFVGGILDGKNQISNADQLFESETKFGFGLTFDSDSEHGIRICFSATLPWLFDNAPIKIEKHINRSRLPELTEESTAICL